MGILNSKCSINNFTLYNYLMIYYCYGQVYDGAMVCLVCPAGIVWCCTLGAPTPAPRARVGKTRPCRPSRRPFTWRKMRCEETRPRKKTQKTKNAARGHPRKNVWAGNDDDDAGRAGGTGWRDGLAGLAWQGRAGLAGPGLASWPGGRAGLASGRR